MPSVLIADDHAPTRAEVAAAVAADARFTVVAVAEDAPSAVRLAVGVRPDVCLLDVRMPGCGIAAAWELAARLPATRLVMLSACAHDGDLFGALRAGACGYLLKDADPRTLPDDLWRALQDGAALPAPLVARVVERLRDRSARRRAPVDVPLTSREWEVLALLREGRSTRDIAAALTLAPVTVRTHVAALLRKTGAPDRAALRDLNAPVLVPPEALAQSA